MCRTKKEETDLDRLHIGHSYLSHSATTVKHGPCLLTLKKKGSRLSKPNAWENFSASWSTRPTTWCVSRTTSVWVHRNLFWQLSRDQNWYGSDMSHVTTKPVLRGTLEGGRRRDRQRKCWMDNIKEWTSLPMPELGARASCRKDLKRISAEWSLMPPPFLPPWSNRSRDQTELNCTNVDCIKMHTLYFFFFFLFFFSRGKWLWNSYVLWRRYILCAPFFPSHFMLRILIDFAMKLVMFAYVIVICVHYVKCVTSRMRI